MNDFPSRAENDLRAIIDDDQSRLSAPPRSRVEELLIELYNKGGGGGGGVKNVHLFCDGSDIYMFDDRSVPLTFEQIKALIADDGNNVFCTNGYYSLHSKYWYQPEIIGTDKEAIGFVGACILRDEPYLWRIIINEDNEVKEDEIWLGKHSDYAALEARVAALEAK